MRSPTRSSVGATAAIIMDDYSFGWTSAAGLIADFCAIGGKITKRVYPPLSTTDYSSYVQQLPAPDTIDGNFWVVGGTGTSSEPDRVRAGLWGARPQEAHRQPVLRVPRCDKVVGPKVVGSYVGGFGTARASRPGRRRPTRQSSPSTTPGLNGGNYADGFVYNYYNAAWAFVQGLTSSVAAHGAKLQAACRGRSCPATRCPERAS